MAKKEIDGVVVEAKSILTALKIIKTVCEDNVNCDNCPMRAKEDNRCLVRRNCPAKWEINEPHEPWRALLP